jgi:hypothetical protein
MELKKTLIPLAVFSPANPLGRNGNMPPLGASGFCF